MYRARHEASCYARHTASSDQSYCGTNFAAKFTSLTEKYKELILHGSIEPVREGLCELQAACREHRVDPHPKLREVVNAVRNWKKSQRKSWQEKVRIGH